MHVRTPDADGLAPASAGCRRACRSTTTALRVTGLDCAAVGELAALHRVVLHELSPHAASLEEAFMELTQDSVDFRTDVDGRNGKCAMTAATLSASRDSPRPSRTRSG